MAPLTAAFAVLGSVAFAVAGCGSGSADRTANPRKLLASASKPIESAGVDGELQLSSAGDTPLPGPATVRIQGPYLSGDGKRIPAFDWKLGGKVEGFGVGGRLVSTGENVLLSLYGDNYEVGRSTVARANEAIAAASGRQAGPWLGADPRPWFGPPRYVGEEEAGGVNCGEVAAPVRGRRLAGNLAPLAAKVGISGPLDVSGRLQACVGFDDHVIHRLAFDLALTGERGGRPLHVWTDGRIELSEVGEPQEISIPGGGGYRPIRELLLNLQDLGVAFP